MSILHAERRAGPVTRLPLALLVLSVVYGISAGAYVTMYYDVVPDMAGREDALFTVQYLLYFAAIASGLPQLLGGLWDIRSGLRRQGLVRLLAFVGPLVVFLGAEGLVAHMLWWNPISDTDRFHLLHHTVTAGAPLTALYAWALWRWWLPYAFLPAPAMTNGFLGLSTVGVVGLAAAVGILFGSPAAGAMVGAAILVAMGLSIVLDPRRTARP